MPDDSIALFKMDGRRDISDGLRVEHALPHRRKHGRREAFAGYIGNDDLMPMLIDAYEIIIVPADFLGGNCAGCKTEVVRLRYAPGDEGHLYRARGFNLLFERNLSF